ncbi:MAG: hypothetical protein K6E94_01185 [Elusimicrobiaceae bacterium]|nr:hypothetical protein [Elusimicrobiaceae bacterium]
MEHTFNSAVYATRLPVIVAVIVLSYILIKAIKALLWKYLGEEKKETLTKLYDFIDPHHQSIFCYQYKWFSSVFIIALITVLCWYLVPPTYIYGEKGAYIASNVLYNPMTYLPNFLIHENVGHNFFCPFTPRWFCVFSGSFMEVTVPFLIYLFSLRLRGGILFSPILLYWLSSALYSVGIYASDALINQHALASSDMVSDFAAGKVKGDWYHILKPFGALEHAQVIGFVIELAACVVFALAIYSCVEYVRRLLQRNISDIM